MKRNSTTISISIMLVCLMVFTSFQGIEARKDNRTYTYHDLILDNTTSGEINAKESVGVTEKNNKKKIMVKYMQQVHYHQVILL